MPRALDPNGPSVQLAPIRVPSNLAARLEAFASRPALFRPSLSAVVRAALEAGITALEAGSPTASPVGYTPAVACAPPAQRTPRKRKPSDEKRAAERAAARAAREAASTPET